MRDLTAARKLSLAFVGVDTHKILRDAGAAVVIDDFRNFDSFLNSVTQSLASSPLKAVSYTHLRAHETSLHLVCRLLLEKK